MQCAWAGALHADQGIVLLHFAYVTEEGQSVALLTTILHLQDKECKATKAFGDGDSGVLASWPGQTFDLSQIYNMTESAMKSDDFDLSNWFSSFLGSSSPESDASAVANVTASG